MPEYQEEFKENSISQVFDEISAGWQGKSRESLQQYVEQLD